MTKNSLTYCGELVRTYDPDRFLLSLVAPPKARPGLWALFAFNYEIAKIRESVTEAMLGRIRLQWWREAVARIYEETHQPGHQVLDALQDAIKKYALPQKFFETLIDAREFDMEGRPHENLQDLLAYADQTSTPLTHLTLKILSVQEDADTVKIISVNYALIGLIRAAPFHRARGKDILPVSVPLNEIAAVFNEKIKTRIKFLKAMQKLGRLHKVRLVAAGYDAEKVAPILFKEIRVLAGGFL